MNATKRFLEEVAESIGVSQDDLCSPRVIQAAQEILKSLGEKILIGDCLDIRTLNGKMYQVDCEKLEPTIAPVIEQ